MRIGDNVRRCERATTNRYTSTKAIGLPPIQHVPLPILRRTCRSWILYFYFIPFTFPETHPPHRPPTLTISRGDSQSVSPSCGGCRRRSQVYRGSKVVLRLVPPPTIIIYFYYTASVDFFEKNSKASVRAEKSKAMLNVHGDFQRPL